MFIEVSYDVFSVFLLFILPDFISSFSVLISPIGY